MLAQSYLSGVPSPTQNVLGIVFNSKYLFSIHQLLAENGVVSFASFTERNEFLFFFVTKKIGGIYCNSDSANAERNP